MLLITLLCDTCKPTDRMTNHVNSIAATNAMVKELIYDLPLGSITPLGRSRGPLSIGIADYNRQRRDGPA